MNSHNPFNTGGCSPCSSGDFNSADQLVDRIIGDAYHVVKEVYLALGNLTYIYNYLQRYGLIITVDSEEAIKDIPLSIGKFARVYSKSDTVGYYFIDYLYVVDDVTGIKPNDPSATGSWISTKATGSNASFVRIWKYHAVADGETTIQLPTDIPIIGVQTIYVQGIRQDINEGFSYNEGDATITLADELSEGELVTVIIGVTDPDLDIDIFTILKGNDGASNIGTSSGETVQESLDSVVGIRESDGYKVIGHVDSIAALREVEPAYDGQLVLVKLSNIRAPIYYVYDSADTSSVDDGGATIVTVGGKCWKLETKSNTGIDNYGFSYNPQTALILSSAYAGLNNRGDLYKGLSNYKIPGHGLKIWRPTFGILEDAVLFSIRNTEFANTDPSIPVLNVKSFPTRAGYPARDHVGGYIGMDSMPATVSTSSTTYTSTTVTSADFASAILANRIRVGMLIDTTDSPKKTGLITGIDAANNTLVIDGWVISGGGGAVSTPAAGTGALVNPMSGLWGMNIIIGLSSAHNVSSAAYIIEGDVRNNKSTGSGHGMYMRCADSTYAAGNAFWAVGGSSAHWSVGLAAQYCDTGLYTDGSTDIGMWSNNTPLAIRIRGATTALAIGTASTNYTTVDGMGVINGLRLKPTIFAAGSTIDNLSVICTGPTITSNATINLPEPTSSRELSRILVLKNPLASTANLYFAGGVEDSSGSIIIRPGESYVVMCNGVRWVTIASKLRQDTLAGTGTLAANVVTVTIPHTLGVVPTAVTPALTSAYTGNFWVSEKTSSSFTLTFSTASTTDVTFNWILRR